MPADPQELESAIAYVFADRSLLVRALTHRSLSSELRHAGEVSPDNEQLEFLGDAVLGFIVSELLLERFPQVPEGQLSVMRARLISAPHLQHVARSLALGEYLRLGHGEEMGGGRTKGRLLANALEALIAALYLDGGMEAARRFVVSHVVGSLDAAEALWARELDFKGPLQERAHRLGLPPPRYVVVESSGPVHNRMFLVEARLGPELSARGEGSTKKAASQNAARALIEQLDKPGPEPTVN